MSAAKPPGLPPGIVLYQMAIGHYVSRALDLAARLGVADLLAAGPRQAAELAAQTRTDAAALRRVLRLLASVGVFSEDADGAFALTPLGELLRSDVPGSARASVMLFAGVGIQDSWKELEYCVRTGQPAFRKHSPDADAFSGMDEEATRVFDAAMATFAPATAAAMAAAYDFSQFGTVMDVGGGNGAILIGLLGANPGLRGIVFDRPGSAERAREKLAEAGLSARCEVVRRRLLPGRAGGRRRLPAEARDPRLERRAGDGHPAELPPRDEARGEAADRRGRLSRRTSTSPSRAAAPRRTTSTCWWWRAGGSAPRRSSARSTGPRASS